MPTSYESTWRTYPVLPLYTSAKVSQREVTAPPNATRLVGYAGLTAYCGSRGQQKAAANPAILQRPLH